jgi:hypothetical protein
MVMNGMTIVPLRFTSITTLKSQVAFDKPLYACLYKEIGDNMPLKIRPANGPLQTAEHFLE